MDEFVNLHTHSDYSVLDGCGNAENFIDRAKEMGQPSIAFTDHGTMSGVYTLHEHTTYIKGIRPIYGVELYGVDDHRQHGLSKVEIDRLKSEYAGPLLRTATKKREKQLKIRDRWHLTAWAIDDHGLQNLYRMTSKAWIDGFYYRPRIDHQMLIDYHEGVMVGSACLSGEINKMILANRFDQAIMLAKWYLNLFGENFFIEIMPNSLDDQRRVNLALAAIATKLNIPMLATVDAHYIHKNDWKYQDALLCINSRTTLSDPNRWAFDTHDFWLHTREEMEHDFRTYHPELPKAVWSKALDNTLMVADRAKAALHIDRFKALVPSPGIPQSYNGNEYEYLADLCIDGWTARDIDRIACEQYAVQHDMTADQACREYEHRLWRELGMIAMKKVVRYFLVIYDLYAFAERKGIARGPGRGSAGGSLVSYLLGITDVDPMEHGLIFERFLNPDRIDMPDIDCDFQDTRRGEIIDYLHERYGRDKVSQIGTQIRMKGKQCLKDIARIMDIPRNEIIPVTNSIVLRSSGDERASQTIEDSFHTFDVCKKFDAKYPQVLEYAKVLEGQVRNLGLHAAGTIVSPVPLTDYVPLETRLSNGKRVVCTGVDMWGAEAQGLMKIDVLGLRTLSVLADAVQKIKDMHGVDVNLSTIDLNDPKVLQGFTDGHFIGVFQFDTISAEKICEGVTFDSFNDIPAMIALDRPGTARSGLATQYLARKRDPSKRISIHPVVDKICEDTLGIIVYQEHVIKIFTDVAGYAPGTADSLRKKIAKKWGDESLGKEREQFIHGAVERGFPEKLAEDLISKITFFGSYGFNKSHATAYGMISYREMWMKTYYPVEFMWGLMRNEPDQEKMRRFTTEARRMKIKVLPPDVNLSGANYEISGGDIVTGVGQIKGVGDKAAQEIEAHNPYANFSDFITSVNRRLVHKGVIDALAKSGALDSMIVSRKWFVEHVDEAINAAKRGYAQYIHLSASAQNTDDYSHTDKQKMEAVLCPQALAEHPIVPYKDVYDGHGIEYVLMNDEDLYAMRYAWVRGIISELRYNQVGDFHSGAMPTKSEQERIKWGARYANVNIEDETTNNRRIKIDWDIFTDYRHIIDKGVGTPVAVLLWVWKGIKAAKALAVFDLSDDELGKNPLWLLAIDPARYTKKLRHEITTEAKQSDKNMFTATGVVIAKRIKLDKNMNDMAWIYLYGPGGAMEVLAFHYAWANIDGDSMKPGSMWSFTVSRLNGGGWQLKKAKKL